MKLAKADGARFISKPKKQAGAPGKKQQAVPWQTANELLPQRVCCPWLCAMPVQHLQAPEQAREDIAPRKIDVTSNPPVGGISVVTLIRTDTTLDHSQKAEKVWATGCRRQEPSKKRRGGLACSHVSAKGRVRKLKLARLLPFGGLGLLAASGLI